MGNSESQEALAGTGGASSSLYRSDSTASSGKRVVIRKFSQSPPRRSGSFRRSGEASGMTSGIGNGMSGSGLPLGPSAALRRSKTCRIRDRSQRRIVCVVTGLTVHQKALLSRKWNRMDKGTIYELGRRVFEGIFTDQSAFLIHIGLKDEMNWRGSVSFRIHVQRFVCALCECMRRLHDPSTACDILRDFGAGYVQEGEKKRVPAVFFETLANALNDVAKQLQEKDHLPFERIRSQSADDPSESSSEGALTSPTNRTPNEQGSTPSSHTIRSSAASSHLPVANSAPSFLNPSCEQRNNGQSEQQSSSTLCPITSEAWMILAVFVANQVKFGYELERLLQNEMNKLGLPSGNSMLRRSIAGPPPVREISLGES